LTSALEGGAEQLGIGLFQIEYRYHAHRFGSTGSMLDPRANSRIAAEILGEGLERTDGDAWAAVGLFHSSTPELAEAYRQRVARCLFNLIVDTGHAQ